MKNKNGNNSDDIFITEADKLKEILGENIENGDESKYVIQDDELRYKPEEVTEQEKEWLIELGIAEVQPVVPEPPIETGNYLVDEKYYDTLQEAINAASSGSEITVISNTSENNLITIDKDITINTNGKTLDFAKESKITIDESINVIINGNGKISNYDNSGSFISNYGNLEIKNSTIESNCGSGTIYGTINNSSGNLIIYNSTIVGNTAVIGGAKIYNGNINGNITGTILLDGGNIDEIDFRNGGSCTINSGTVRKILMGNNANNIYLTIGNIDKTVNNNDPQIESIEVTTGDLAGITCSIEFYNGIVKKGLEDNLSWIYGEYTIRPGYKIETTSEGTILVEE